MTAANGTTETGSAASGTDIIRSFLPASPFVGHLGIELLELEDGHAVLRLPFRDEVITIGSTVHGGAIASLIDTAAMAAAWAGAEVPDQLRGATVALAVQYLAAAQSEDVTATAHVRRRGSSLVFVTVDVTAGDERLVATAQITYRIG